LKTLDKPLKRSAIFWKKPGFSSPVFIVTGAEMGKCTFSEIYELTGRMLSATQLQDQNIWLGPQCWGKATQGHVNLNEYWLIVRTKLETRKRMFKN
jgi:hypothetical protein